MFRFLGKFAARFSKAIGALGGTGVGTLIGVVATSVFHANLSPAITAALPIIGGVFVTVIAPPNSITTPPAGS